MIMKHNRFFFLIFCLLCILTFQESCNIPKRIANEPKPPVGVNENLECDIIRDDSIIVFVEGFSYRTGYEAYKMALQYAKIKILHHLDISGNIVLPPLNVVKSETLEEVETGKIISQLVVSVNRNKILELNENNDSIKCMNPLIIKDSTVIMMYELHTINTPLEIDTIINDRWQEYQKHKSHIDLKQTETTETPLE